MNRRYFLDLKHVAREEGGDQQHDGDEQSPRGEELLLRSIAL